MLLSAALLKAVCEMLDATQALGCKKKTTLSLEWTRKKSTAAF